MKPKTIEAIRLKPAVLDKYKILGEEIALIKAGCESCEETENLTLHI